MSKVTQLIRNIHALTLVWLSLAPRQPIIETDFRAGLTTLPCWGMEGRPRGGEGKTVDAGHTGRRKGKGISVLPKGTQILQNKSFFSVFNKRNIFSFYNCKHFERGTLKLRSVLWVCFSSHLSHFSFPLGPPNKSIRCTQFSLLFGAFLVFGCLAHALIESYFSTYY